MNHSEEQTDAEVVKIDAAPQAQSLDFDVLERDALEALQYYQERNTHISSAHAVMAEAQLLLLAELRMMHAGVGLIESLIKKPSGYYGVRGYVFCDQIQQLIRGKP